MTQKPSLCSRLVSMGISAPYASQLSRGVRTPSLSLALRIYRQLDVKMGPLVGASKAEIATLERVAERAA